MSEARRGVAVVFGPTLRRHAASVLGRRASAEKFGEKAKQLMAARYWGGIYQAAKLDGGLNFAIRAGTNDTIEA